MANRKKAIAEVDLPVVDVIDTPTDELQRLLVDASETYEFAAKAGAFGAASQALSVRHRILNTLAERAASKEKQEDFFAGVDVADEHSFPPALQSFLFKYFDGLIARVNEAKAEAELSGAPCVFCGAPRHLQTTLEEK